MQRIQQASNIQRALDSGSVSIAISKRAIAIVGSERHLIFALRSARIPAPQ